MGKLVKRGDELFFQQDDGEITAVLTGFEEKNELVHEGSGGYRKVFYILVAAGALYLALVFFGIF
jgi:hypothetical protein